MIPDTIDRKIVAGGKIALGFLAGKMVKGKMKGLAQGVGAGVAANGAIELLKEFNVLSGSGDDMLEVSLNGDQDYIGADDLSTINEDVLGENDLSTVNADVLGDDDED